MGRNVAVAAGVAVAVGGTVGAEVGLGGIGEGVGATVCVAVAVKVAVAVFVGGRVAVGRGVFDAVGVPVGVAVAGTVGTGVCVGSAVGVAVGARAVNVAKTACWIASCTCAVCCATAAGLRLEVAVAGGDVGVTGGVAVGLGVCVTVAVGMAVCVSVAVTVGWRVGVAVAVLVGAGVRVGGIGVAVAVTVAVGGGVSAVAVKVPWVFAVAMAWAVACWLCAIWVASTVGVAVRVGVADGCVGCRGVRVKTTLASGVAVAVSNRLLVTGLSAICTSVCAADVLVCVMGVGSNVTVGAKMGSAAVTVCVCESCAMADGMSVDVANGSCANSSFGSTDAISGDNNRLRSARRLRKVGANQASVPMTMSSTRSVTPRLRPMRRLAV